MEQACSSISVVVGMMIYGDCGDDAESVYISLQSAKGVCCHMYVGIYSYKGFRMKGCNR